MLNVVINGDFVAILPDSSEGHVAFNSVLVATVIHFAVNTALPSEELVTAVRGALGQGNLIAIFDKLHLRRSTVNEGDNVHVVIFDFYVGFYIAGACEARSFDNVDFVVVAAGDYNAGAASDRNRAVVGILIASRQSLSRAELDRSNAVAVIGIAR